MRLKVEDERQRHTLREKFCVQQQERQEEQQEHIDDFTSTTATVCSRDDMNSISFLTNGLPEEHSNQDAKSMRELVGDFGMTLFNPLACLPQCSTGIPPRSSCNSSASMITVETHEEIIPQATPICCRSKNFTQEDKQKISFQTNSKSPFLATTSSPCTDSSCATLTLESIASTAATTTIVEDAAIPLEIQVEPETQLEECPRILTSAMMQQLHDEGLPESLHLCRWERCFAIGRDGDSFCTLLECCAPFLRTFVVIQTLEGHVLGGFAALPWNKRDCVGNTYYGTGQSFLFASHPDGYAKPARASRPLHIFRWTGKNDFCQICDAETQRLGMGGGADFGFLVQDNFWRGRSGPCGTFGNPSLTPNEYFEIEALEVYGLRPFGESISLTNLPLASSPLSTSLSSTVRGSSSFF